MVDTAHGAPPVAPAPAQELLPPPVPVLVVAELVDPPVGDVLVEPPVFEFPAALELPPVELVAPLLGVVLGLGLLLLDEQPAANKIADPAMLETQSKKQIDVVFMLLNLTVAGRVNRGPFVAGWG